MDDHSVKLEFADPDNKQNRFFSGAVDRVVFGQAEYQWHADPVPAGQTAPQLRHRGWGTGHADPDGPPSKSTVSAAGPETLYQLPKASIIVLRGKLSN